MKRIINASLFSYSPYQKVPAYIVTNGYLKYLPVTLPNSIVSKIVKGIQAWKSSNGICYHHIDADTSNQNPDNIAFINSQAHGYIHNPQTELKLMRCYGLLVPTYLQGYRAEEAEHAMYSKLFKDLSKSGLPVYTAFKKSRLANGIFNICLNKHSVKIWSISPSILTNIGFAIIFVIRKSFIK